LVERGRFDICLIVCLFVCSGALGCSARASSAVATSNSIQFNSIRFVPSMELLLKKRHLLSFCSLLVFSPQRKVAQILRQQQVERWGKIAERATRARDTTELLVRRCKFCYHQHVVLIRVCRVMCCRACAVGAVPGRCSRAWSLGRKIKSCKMYLYYVIIVLRKTTDWEKSIRSTATARRCARRAT
jgi:hypothetical protein